MNSYGILTLLPVAIVILLACITKKTTLSLVTASLVGAVMVFGWSFPKEWISVVYGVIGSDMYIWIVLVCGFFGSLIKLFEKSGSIFGFTDITAKVCRGQKSTLVVSLLLGILMFVDDWLSMLTVGTAMRHTADRRGVSREKLAFTSNLTATSACVLVPISTWGVFMISQLVSTGVCTSENQLSAFAKTLPFIMYPFIALICVALFALKILPDIGPMRRTEARAMREETDEKIRKSSALYFLLPLALITAVSIVTGEILYGTLGALLFCGILYIPKRLMSFSDYLRYIVEGFKDMIGVLFIVAGAFILRDINAILKMPEFVINAMNGVLSPHLLPLFAFLVVVVLGTAAGNYWGICAISFPVIIPLAQAMDVNLYLVSGAIISATVAASHVCFFGSEATLSSAAAEIDNITYAKTCIPMALVPVGIASVAFLIAGFVL